MMVTWVHGLFKDMHGQLRMDLDDPLSASFTGEIDAAKIWTGEPDRDAHPRSADFFDVENHPIIAFTGRLVERTCDTHFQGKADLTIPRDHPQGHAPGGGVVVSNELEITLDIEAILGADLQATGAIDYYRPKQTN